MTHELHNTISIVQFLLQICSTRYSEITPSQQIRELDENRKAALLGSPLLNWTRVKVPVGNPADSLEDQDTELILSSLPHPPTPIPRPSIPSDKVLINFHGVMKNKQIFLSWSVHNKALICVWLFHHKQPRGTSYCFKVTKLHISCHLGFIHISSPFSQMNILLLFRIELTRSK